MTTTKTEYIEQNFWLQTNTTIDDYLNNNSVIPFPTKEAIEEFADYNHLDYDTAKDFFNVTCDECGKKIVNKPEIGINIKYFGDSTKYYCEDCFKKRFHFNDVEYQKRIQIFRAQNCTLF